MDLGFAKLGLNVLVSDRASLYGCARISIGDNVRVDDFCVLSAGEGGIEIGNYIHLGVYSSLIGAGKIVLEDFCGISSRVSVYSSNDDYSGQSMTNPTVPEEFTNVQHADVTIGRHAIIGAGSVILPGVILGQGVVVGALSLVTKSCQDYGVYSGTPARFIKERKKNFVQLEQLLRVQSAE
ncbi:acyltransferase [Pseudomonas sp. PDM15]|uniref:acyltransferase n=1 Tax=Pseudomonas sp. PDM15 TaxID=2769303 RepID=UPI001CE17969|nr:acyltransferase [Pseudomonas sp. PDM15]